MQRQYIVDLMAPINTRTVGVAAAEEALRLLSAETFDCVVLDLGLPERAGWRVIDELCTSKALASAPLIVYASGELTKRDQARLSRAARSIALRDVRSPERLKYEITAVLSEGANGHRAEAHNGHSTDAQVPELAGRKVLIVDDDVRNIFALTALLERQQMEVVSVDSGQEALEFLEDVDDIEIALVDVMMPEMDGYALMSKMRSLPTFGDRPIVALTAKAMKGDREKCIDAGASDYIAKPIDNAHLLAMLKSCVRR